MALGCACGGSSDAMSESWPAPLERRGSLGTPEAVRMPRSVVFGLGGTTPGKTEVLELCREAEYSMSSRRQYQRAN